MKQELSWMAQRNGKIYCAPACGGGCTWHDYQQAVRRASAMVKKLGPGWEPCVHENLGWHCGAINSEKQLDVSYQHYRGLTYYSAILAHQFCGSGKTPAASVEAAIKAALPELERYKKLIAVIESM